MDFERIAAVGLLFSPAPSVHWGKGSNGAHMIEWHLLVRGLLQNLAAFREGRTPPACQSGCQAKPLHLSLWLSFSVSFAPDTLQERTHMNVSVRSCIANTWKQAVIKFSLCVLCTQYSRYQYVLSDGLHYLNMEVNWHWRYLMSAHSSMAAGIDLSTLKVLGVCVCVCSEGFCFFYLQ